MHLKDGQSSYTPPMDLFTVLDHVGNNYLNKNFSKYTFNLCFDYIIVNSQKKTTAMQSRGVAHCPIANGVPDSRQP